MTILKIPQCLSELNVLRQSPLLERLSETVAPGDAYNRLSSPADTPHGLDCEIRCSCGAESAQLLGYAAESSTGDVLAGVFALDCPHCQTVAEFLDDEKHGYFAELDVITNAERKSSKVHWQCESCNEKEVRIAVFFRYQSDEDVDTERPQDFFDTFAVVANCTGCNEVSVVSQFLKNPRCLRKLLVLRESELLSREHLPVVNHQDPGLNCEVRCACGAPSGQLLFHAGPEPDMRCGPFAIECPACSQVTELIDEEVHGYNGEMDGPRETEPEGSKEHWTCRECEETLCNILVSFDYQVPPNADEEFAQHFEDFFDTFSMAAKCVACDQISDVASFECA